MQKVYRVEDPKEGHGLWRNFDGSPCKVFDQLTVGKCKDMPMDDNDFYRYGSKQWFSATDSPEKLKAWFDVLDVVQLRELGYRVYQLEVTNIRQVSEYEVVFTRDSIDNAVAIDPGTIWENFDTVLKNGTPSEVENK